MLGIPPTDVARETCAMSQIAFGPTASRSVLGCMNEASNVLHYELAFGRKTSLSEIEMGLSDFIYAATNYEPPGRRAARLFAESASL
jgi:hypothetical protein